MILGIGSDMVDIRRIEKTLKRFGKNFEKKYFTAPERDKARSRKHAGAKAVAAVYAKRFAAKEAAAKALGIFKEGTAWRDIEITNGKNNAPLIHFSGAAAKQLKAMTPKKYRARALITLADEYPYALAFVMIVAEKK